MKQIKILGVLAIALTLGLAACNGGGNDGDKSGSNAGESGSRHVHTFDESKWEYNDTHHWHPATCEHKSQKGSNAKHEFGEPTNVKAATCQAEGSQDVVCSICQAKITQTLPKLEHQFVADPDKPNKPATCTVDGENYFVCSVCGEPKTEIVTAPGHQWAKAADQAGAIAPTCTEPGTQIEECSVCHEKRSVAVAATGHEFDEGTPLEVPDPTEKNTKGEVPFHWATITNYSCKHGDSYRYAWSAKEVNFDYKTVADGADPELLDDGEGIRFWGRPIGNAMELSSDGRATASSVSVPDPSVKGSRFEFDFIFDTDLTDVCLSAEFTPARYTSDVFKNADNTEDWTPGYKNITVKTEGVHYTAEEIAAAVEGDDAYGKTVDDWKVAPEYEGEKIKPFRFIILLDGVEVALDKNVDTRANGRAWYQFPCKLNLSAGKHNLNIAMSGGYLHTFYNFSFEKVAPAHEHKFGAGTVQTDEVESTIAQCPCGVEQIRWDANKFNTTESSSDVQKDQATGVSGDTNKGMKLDGDVYNKGSGSNQSTPATEASTGCHANYNVNVPVAKTGAKLLIKGVRNSSTAVGMFSMQSNDNSKSWYEKTAGEAWVRYEWRYKLIVNGVDIPFTPYTTENPEPSTGSKKYVEFAFPCTFDLQQGVNKIELQKWGGYTLIVTELAFEY